MNIVISLASVLVCAVSMHAQIATTVRRLPDGSNEITIRNNGSMPLTAFAVGVDVIGERRELGPASLAPLDTYYDPATDFITQPLPPNQDRVLPLVQVFCAAPPRNPTLGQLIAQQRASGSYCEFKQPVAAGIYADGTTTGDRALLANLLSRRSNMLLAVETALDTLNYAGRRNAPRDELIAQFQKMADSARRWYVPREQQIAGNVYQSEVEKLVNLPEDARLVPDAFVAQESARLRGERLRLIESQPSLAEAASLVR
jgi:hypothetical protein